MSSAARLGAVALLVHDYDRAIAWFKDRLGFRLLEDERIDSARRWVVVGPPGGGTALLLARAATAEQRARIGKQAAGRVFLFLETGDFDADHAAMTGRGVRFLEAPRSEPYGKVAVFEDLCGNRWDLIGRP
ncbi:MAG: VOC family protein [Cucumibacter sp.]